jgi:3-oxoacyl-[acyl-carrier protein] reductase
VRQSRRVALVDNAKFYVGPPLARLLAASGHDLVIGDPANGLVEELEDLGAAVEVVTGVHDLAEPSSAPRLVQAGLARFGRIDSATAFSGQVVVGRFLNSTEADLAAVVRGCIEAPYHFLKATCAAMKDNGGGQILLITSASAVRPTPGAPLYSSARAAGTMLAKNVAGEMARFGLQVNAVGTNFMDFPEFLRASGGDDPEVRAKLEAQVPLGRLGTVDEFAHFCMPFVDGKSGFTTGQFVAYAGGWA